VENSLPARYDYRGHLDNPSRLSWGAQELVAEIHLTNGNKAFGKGDWIQAQKHCNMAVPLNPHYEKAHLHWATVLDIMETNKIAR
jgi:Tfp pilus assembly protein PilF